MDALVCGGPVPSLAHLSRCPAARGGYGRCSRALAHGTLDVLARRALVAAQPFAGGAQRYAIDASPWLRPEAVTSPARGFCHHTARASGCGQPAGHGRLE